MIVMFNSIVWGQFTEKWSVEQSVSEKGILFIDLNADGTSEVFKFLGNGMTVYDGAQDYSIVWQLNIPSHEYISLWQIYDLDQDGNKEAIVINYTTTEPASMKISSYPIYGETATWSSAEYSGTFNYIEVSDMDADNSLELIFGRNVWNPADSTYTSHLHILDGTTGAVEWSLSDINGYLIGPYVGDVDNDQMNDILFNLYDFSNGVSSLFVYGNTGNTVQSSPDRKVISNSFTLKPLYPNPFNPSTTIPILLESVTDVDLQFYNSLGQLVYQMNYAQLAPGNHELKWRGVDYTGHKLPSGLYHCRITTDMGMSSRPIVLLK